MIPHQAAQRIEILDEFRGLVGAAVLVGIARAAALANRLTSKPSATFTRLRTSASSAGLNFSMHGGTFPDFSKSLTATGADGA